MLLECGVRSVCCECGVRSVMLECVVCGAYDVKHKL